MRTLVLVHATRIVAVIVVLPIAIQFFSGQDLNPTGSLQIVHGEPVIVDWLVLAGCGIAGYLVGKLLRVPDGIILPTILISAIVHASGVTEIGPPSWLVAIVQTIIGSAARARFAGVTARALSETVVQSLIWAAILIGASAGTAMIGSVLLNMPVTALVLALAPGGTADMTMRIVEADIWDREFLDLVDPATMTIGADGHGEIAFGAMQASLDLEHSRSIVSFTWAGFDEMDAVNGSGSAERLENGSISIEFAYHLGDEAVLKAERAPSSTAC